MCNCLKMLIVTVPITTTVTVISRGECLGKQRGRKFLTLEWKGSTLGIDVWVFGYSPGCDRLSDQTGFEIKGLSPVRLFHMKEDPGNRCPASNGTAFSRRSGAQQYCCPPGGGITVLAKGGKLGFCSECWAALDST